MKKQRNRKNSTTIQLTTETVQRLKVIKAKVSLKSLGKVDISYETIILEALNLYENHEK